MSFPALFKDLGKNANDLVNKGYISSDKYHWKIEVDTTSENGIQFLPSLTENPAGGLEGELKAKFKSFNFTFTTSANLKNELTLEAASNDSIRGLLKPTLTLSTDANNPVERARFKANSEVRFATANLTANVDFPLARFLNEVSFKPEQPKATLSGVFGHKDSGVSIGTEAEFSADSGQVIALNVVTAYVQRNLEVALFLKKRQNVNVGANFYQRVLSSRFQDSGVGAEITHDLSSEKPPVLTIAATGRAETATFKGRITSRGVLGLAITQRFEGPLSMTFGTDIQLLNREPGSVQWGLKIAYK